MDTFGARMHELRDMIHLRDQSRRTDKLCAEHIVRLTSSLLADDPTLCAEIAAAVNAHAAVGGRLISQSEYAGRRGASSKSVHRAVRNGLLSVADARGQLYEELADRQLAAADIEPPTGLILAARAAVAVRATQAAAVEATAGSDQASTPQPPTEQPPPAEEPSVEDEPLIEPSPAVMPEVPEKPLPSELPKGEWEAPMDPQPESPETEPEAAVMQTDGPNMQTNGSDLQTGPIKPPIPPATPHPPSIPPRPHPTPKPPTPHAVRPPVELIVPRREDLGRAPITPSPFHNDVVTVDRAMRVLREDNIEVLPQRGDSYKVDGAMYSEQELIDRAVGILDRRESRKARKNSKLATALEVT